MCISLHTLQEIEKINDEIYGTSHDNLFKRVPIQKWDICDLIPEAIMAEMNLITVVII